MDIFEQYLANYQVRDDLLWKPFVEEIRQNVCALKLLYEVKPDEFNDEFKHEFNDESNVKFNAVFPHTNSTALILTRNDLSENISEIKVQNNTKQGFSFCTCF